MEFSTEEIMDAQIYTYTRYNSEELVSGDGNAQRNIKMGQDGSKVQGKFYHLNMNLH
jgi:hypothetical protein